MKKLTKKFITIMLCLLGIVFSSCKGFKNIPISQFSFTLTSQVVEKGESCLIKEVNIFPTNASNKTIEYWIDNPTIASIENETITGLSKGSTYVWGKTTDGSDLTFSVALTVTETAAAITGLELSLDIVSTYVGESVIATVNVLPENADKKAYQLISSKGIVSINGDVIKCLEADKTYITAKSTDGTNIESNSVELTVKPSPTTGISLTAKKTTLMVGYTSQLTVLYTPSSSMDKDVSFTTKSGTNNIISVNSSGLVTAIGNGTDKVVACLKSNPSIKDEISITVSDVEPQSITINLPDKIYVNDVIQVSVTINPSGAFTSEANYSITSGSSCASISSTGLLLISKAGSITIHAYLVDRPLVTSDITFTSLNKSNPTDPYKDDIFAGV